MKTIMKCALLAVAMLAAAPAMAQSTVGGRGGDDSGGQSNGGGNGGGGNAGGGGEGNGRLERLHVVCVAAPCGPRRQRPHISLNRAVLGDLCGQQLTFGREAIFYYERCDNRM